MTKMLPSQEGGIVRKNEEVVDSCGAETWVARENGIKAGGCGRLRFQLGECVTAGAGWPLP
jgi:hypothetical protein